jgi:3-isopropylmalate/(R)-2-methylmalate dehydratase large subunit
LLFLGLKVSRFISRAYFCHCRSQYPNHKSTFVEDPLSANQLKALEENSKEYGISHWGLGTNGIVHVVGPENGITLPGATIVCGDSHTLHVAWRCFGLVLEVEMVLSTQCIMQPKPKKNAY